MRIVKRFTLGVGAIVLCLVASAATYPPLRQMLAATVASITYTSDIWEDLRVPVNALAPGATPADIISFGPSGNLRARGFDGAATLESMEGAVQLPHAWKEGTDLKPHVHWTATTNAGGNVKWNFEYVWFNIGTAAGAPTTLSVTTAASTTPWTQQISGFGDISGTGKLISSMIVFRVYRNPSDAADTYGDDAALLEVDFHHKVDAPGSLQELIK